jgi:hypothetical protein
MLSKKSLCDLIRRAADALEEPDDLTEDERDELVTDCREALDEIEEEDEIEEDEEEELGEITEA